MTKLDMLKEKFDDISEGEDGVWSQICNACSKRLQVPSRLLDEGAGHGICGVKGCSEESDHYIDFD